MKKHDKADEFVESRCVEWAYWFKSGLDFGLGYPKETVEYRLWKQGCVVKQSNGGTKVLETNKRAEEIEKCVMDLQKLKPMHAKLLRSWYFSDKRTPKEAIARRLKLPLSTAEYKIRECKFFILRSITSNGWS